MESLTKRIKIVNTIISAFSLWGPVILFLIELYGKLAKKNLFIILPQLTPKMIISGLLLSIVLYSLKLFWDLQGANLDSQANKESFDYLRTVDLYLENNFKMVSQKQFSCLIAVISIIAFTDFDNIRIYLAFLSTISVTNMISFSLLYFMSPNNKKRKEKEYLWLVTCVLTNLLTPFLFFVVIIKLTIFPGLPTNWVFGIHDVVYILLLLFVRMNYNSKTHLIKDSRL